MNRDIELKINLVGRDTFVEGVRQLFLESFLEMNDVEDKQLHIDMADFARTTDKAINEKNTYLVHKHFEFISQLFQKANPDLENAIFVSYLENIFIGNYDTKYSVAKKLLPSNLVKALSELEEHFDKLYESSKGT